MEKKTNDRFCRLFFEFWLDFCGNCAPRGTRLWGVADAQAWQLLYTMSHMKKETERHYRTWPLRSQVLALAVTHTKYLTGYFPTARIVEMESMQTVIYS